MKKHSVKVYQERGSRQGICWQGVVEVLPLGFCCILMEVKRTSFLSFCMGYEELRRDTR